MKAKSNNSKKFAIKLFISSTFKEMQAERNALDNMVFPQIRKLCG